LKRRLGIKYKIKKKKKKTKKDYGMFDGSGIDFSKGAF